MATPTGSLVVKLTADTTEFDRRMKAATRNVTAMTRQMRSAVNTAGKYATAIAAAGVALGSHIVANAAAAGREIQNLSRISDTGVETFQKHAFGARTVGIELDKLADIYKDTKDRVGDFLQTGGGPMADFFENIAPKVGVTAEQFRKLSGPEALQLFVSSLEAANVSQSEMVFYMEAMASDATALLPLLRNNGKEMARLAEQADAAGLALSDIEITQLDMASRAIDTVSSGLSGVANRIAVSLSPIITAAAKKFQEAAEETQGFQDQIGGAMTFGVHMVGIFADGLHGLKIIAKGIALAFQSLGVGILSTLSLVKEGWDRILAELAGGLASLTRQINQIPGIDIPTDGLDAIKRQLQASAEGHVQFRAELVASVKQTKADIDQVMMEELPSEGWKRFVEEARIAGAEAAAELNKSMSGGNEDSDNEGDRKDTGSTHSRAELKKRLDAIRQSIATEQELEAENFQTQKGELAAALAAQLITREEHNALLEKSHQAHIERMSQIKGKVVNLDDVRREKLLESFETEKSLVAEHEQAMKDLRIALQEGEIESQAEFNERKLQLQNDFYQRFQGIQNTAYQGIQRLTAQHFSAEAAETAGAMQNILGTLSASSKSAFEIQKKWALADALVSTYQGIAAGVKLGWPAGIPAVAWAAATGFAQVRAIRSQSFGGGGGSGGAAASGGGSAPAQSAGLANPQPPAQDTARVIDIQGFRDDMVFSGRQLRSLIEQINDAQEDGTVVLRAS